MKQFVIALLPITLLAACGGSGGGIDFIEVPADAETVGDTDVEVEVTPSGDTITVTKSGGPVALSTMTAPDFGTFRTAVDPAAIDYTVAFVSTGDGSVAGGAVYEDGADETHGVFYERIGTTNLPTTGSAMFTGDYFAMLIDTTDGGSASGLGITGDASLTADFEGSTVTGEIANREVIDLVTGDPFPTVTADETMQLNLTSLTTTGTFFGSVTGGAITSGMVDSTVSAASFYTGLIAGTDADEAVGAVSALHTLTGDIVREVGTFAAGH